MPNIRTLRDYEDTSKPNTRPLPNPWTNRSSVSRLERGPDEMEAMGYHVSYQQQPQMQLRDPFWSHNIPEGEPMKWYHVLCMCFCPCCVGNPCSPVRRQDYLRMIKTFIFWVGIVQILYFIAELITCGVRTGSPFVTPSENPTLGPSGDTMLVMGAKYAPYIKHKWQVYRYVVPIIMHAGIIHIFVNLILQFRLGLVLEMEWNWWRMIIVYITSGIGGNLLSCVAKPWDIGVGASGALLGVIGAKLAHIICTWHQTDKTMRIMNVIQYSIFLVITFAFGFSKYVDWAAHLGGLVVGFFLGLVLFWNLLPNRKVGLVVMSTSAFLAVAFFAVFVGVFYGTSIAGAY